MSSFRKLGTKVIRGDGEIEYEVEIETIGPLTVQGRTMRPRGLIKMWRLNDKGRRLSRTNAEAIFQFDAAGLDEMGTLLHELARVVRAEK